MLAQRGHETGALDNFSVLQCHRIVVLQIAMVPVRSFSTWAPILAALQFATCHSYNIGCSAVSARLVLCKEAVSY